MGMKIERLSNEEEKAMRNVLTAKKTYYLSPDKTKVFERGDKEMPPGSSLLCRAGSEVSPEAAEHFGLETEEGQSVARVELRSSVSVRDRSLGVGKEVAAGYDRLDVTSEIHEATAGAMETANRSGASTSRQVTMMREAVIEEVLAPRSRATDASLPETTGATPEKQGLGGAGAGNEEITRKLEEGEEKALGAHLGRVESAKSDAKEEAQNEGAGGDSVTSEQRAPETGGPGEGGLKSDPPPATNTRTKKVGAAKGSSKKAGAKAASKKTATGGEKGGGNA